MKKNIEFNDESLVFPRDTAVSLYTALGKLLEPNNDLRKQIFNAVKEAWDKEEEVSSADEQGTPTTDAVMAAMQPELDRRTELLNAAHLELQKYREAIDQIKKIHVSRNGYCNIDGGQWPCATLRACEEFPRP